MRRIILLVACMLLVVAGGANAAGLPFTKKPVTHNELASALETNDEDILNVTCDEYIAAMQHFHPDARIEECEDLALYVRNLEVGQFDPNTKFVFGRLLVGKSRRELDFNWSRNSRQNERGLYDRNLQRFIASADCGNVGRMVTQPVTKKRQEQRGDYVSTTRRMARPMFAPTGVDFGTAYRDCPQGSGCGWANELTGESIEGASHVGWAATLRPPKYKNKTVIDNDISSHSSADATNNNNNDIDVRGGDVDVDVSQDTHPTRRHHPRHRHPSHHRPTPPPDEPPHIPPPPPPPIPSGGPTDPGTPPTPPVDPGTPPFDGGGPVDPGSSGPVDPGS